MMDEVAADDRFDHCSQLGAIRLAERVASYWRARGYDKIRVGVKPVDSDAYGECFAVTSNIGATGFPPL